VLERAGSLGDDAFTYVHPDYAALPPGTLPTKMRVVVVAEACVNGVPSKSEVADFTEISIRP
jgi:hypothetical protein